MTTDLLFRDDAYREDGARHRRRRRRARHRAGPHPLLPAGRRPARRYWHARARDGSAHRDRRYAQGQSPDSVLHVPRARCVAPARSVKPSTLELDWERRYALMRLHTALHVMSCVVVAPVTGGNISPDKGRLDFDIDMSLLDAAKIERETNALIARAVATETVWITDEELDARPELVKTMSVQPPRGAGRVRLLQDPRHRSATLRRHSRRQHRRDRRYPRAQASATKASTTSGWRSRWRAEPSSDRDGVTGDAACKGRVSYTDFRAGPIRVRPLSVYRASASDVGFAHRSARPRAGSTQGWRRP